MRLFGAATPFNLHERYLGYFVADESETKDTPTLAWKFRSQFSELFDICLDVHSCEDLGFETTQTCLYYQINEIVGESSL